MTAPELVCAKCGRRGGRVIDGIAGKLIRCACSDRDDAPMRWMPAVDAGRQEAIAADRRYHAALRRGLQKRQTDEGRAKLTKAEAEALARYDAAR